MIGTPLLQYTNYFSMIFLALIAPFNRNGNRTEWSPIQSVIIQVIEKIRCPQSRSPIHLITSVITDRIGWHEVLLPINHNYNKRIFLNLQHKKVQEFFLLAVEKAIYVGECMMYCPITLSY